MKNIEVLIILSIILIGCKLGRNISPMEQVNLYPIGKNGKWGFANEEGNVTIPYQFDKVTFYKGGRASVKVGGKFRFINKLGEYEQKIKYDSIGYFNYEEAIVVKNGKILTIDRHGNKLKKGILIERCGFGIENTTDLNPHFERIDNKYVLNKRDFENQQRLNPKSRFKLSDFTFDEIIPFSAKSIIVKKNNKYDIYVHYNSIGLKGIWAEEIVPLFDEEINSKSLIAAANAKFKIDGKWGLISKLGYVELKPEFHEIEKAEGMFYIVEYKPKHWGCITLEKRFFKK